jgi:axial budding pattern protein 2
LILQKAGVGSLDIPCSEPFFPNCRIPKQGIPAIRIRPTVRPSKKKSMVLSGLLLSLVFSASVDLCALPNIFILSKCSSGHTLIRAIGVPYSIVSTEPIFLEKMALRGIISAAAICGTVVVAIPTITFPLNSQVPPVARISEPFSYAFSISTFSSTLPITYNVSNGPSWLSLDSSTRTLYGTPSIADAGMGAVTGISIDITASDSSGSITEYATLIISKNPAPVISIPLSVQFQSITTFSAPSTLLYHPSTPFTVNLQPGTFSGLNLIYYAVTVENTPLPSWISFDQSSLKFTGQTPSYQSLIQPPQTFGVQLIASDVEGFSGVAIYFDIEVGVHLLSFKNAALDVNATVGDTINFTGLASNLEIDGQSANSSDIVSISARTPSWLSFDNYTLAISGNVPSGAAPCNITIQATDIYGDTANAVVYIDTFTSLFTNEIGAFNVTIGMSFAYDLSLYVRNKSDIAMTAQFFPAEPWLSFDSHTFILAGQVSSTTKLSSISITLLAVSKSSNESSSQTFDMAIVSTTYQASLTASFPSRTSKSPSISQTGSSTMLPDLSEKPFSKKIILAIVLPIVTMLTCILLALFCYTKRRRDARKHSPKISKSEISGPFESSTSILEIVRPTNAEPPKPLELDMTGFGGDTRSSNPRELQISPKRPKKPDIRRSQTLSDISGPRRSQILGAETSGNRTRSHSEIAMSKADSSWDTTQDSGYPTAGSSRTNSSNTRLSRKYSNYSRKGHTRRSVRVYSADHFLPLPDVLSTSPPVGESILNLRDSNFSFTPIERFSVVKSNESIQQTIELSSASKRLNRTISTRRQSSLMPMLSRPPSGIGHGIRRNSIYSMSENSKKRRSIGHGQDWTSGQSLARNSKTWLTMGSSDGDELDRRSTVSGLSEYADMSPEDTLRFSTIRQVAKSTLIPLSAHVSANSRHTRRYSRPVSRRLDSSPFFGGSALRKSRRSPKKSRTSYADSPTVPEEATMSGALEAVPQGIGQRSDNIPRDSFGISYGMAREGTRQLKSYVQSHLSRSRTRSSMRSTESKDSRFESASGSMMSLHKLQTQQRPENQGGDDEYEDYLPDNCSEGEGSWETQHSAQEGQGNVDEIAEVTAALAISKPKLTPRTKVSSSNPNSPLLDMGSNRRMLTGASRFISVDANANKRASTATIESGELDYAAYI